MQAQSFALNLGEGGPQVDIIENSIVLQNLECGWLKIRVVLHGLWVLISLWPVALRNVVR